MNRSKLFLPFLFLIVVFGVLFVSNAEIISSYIIDGDTVYIDDENIYIGTTPHTVYGDGWVTSNIITKSYSGNLNIAYGFNTSSIYPTKAELYDPYVAPYTTNHRAWFYNVSSIINTLAATPIDYGNDYNTYRYTITYQKCISYDEMSTTCNEWTDETAVVAFDSHETDGTNYTAFWHTDRTRIKNYRDISHLFTETPDSFSYDGKNKWYYVTDIPFVAGEMRSVRTYIKVNGVGDKYDIAVWPSHLTIQQAIAAGYFYLLDPWAEVSELNFTSPTPANESTVYVNHTTINVSIATSDLTYFAFNWNGTNVTYTTAGTEWNQLADSYVRSTTVGSYTQPDFDNIFPWSHMRRCTLWDNGTVNYYLNSTNSSLKATGGLSDISGADGQVMVEIPKFYYTHMLTGSEHDWEISRFNISGFSVHNAFIKDGVEVDHRYMAVYEASFYDVSESQYTNGIQYPATAAYLFSFTTAADTITAVAGTSAALSHPFSNLEVGDKIVVTNTANNNGVFTVASVSDQSITVSENLVDEADKQANIETQKDFTVSTGDKLSSVSGKAPINYGTRAEFRVAAENRGSGWRQQDFDLVSAIQLLYLIEYADFNSQSTIGNGLTSWSSAWPAWNHYNPIEKTGNSNGDGDVTNSVSNGNGVTGSYMSYRGIENFYGHLWKWVDGINVYNNIPYVTNNASNWSDDTSTGYTNLSVTLANSNGYQVTLADTNRGFLPASVGGSSSTYICDYYYQNTGWRVAKLGGCTYIGLTAGGFDWALSNSAAYRIRSITARVCY